MNKYLPLVALLSCAHASIAYRPAPSELMEHTAPSAPREDHNQIIISRELRDIFTSLANRCTGLEQPIDYLTQCVHEELCSYHTVCRAIEQALTILSTNSDIDQTMSQSCLKLISATIDEHDITLDMIEPMHRGGILKVFPSILVGTARINNTLISTGQVIINAQSAFPALKVIGSSIFNGGVTITGGANIDSLTIDNIIISGSTTLGNTTINGNLDVSGTTSTNALNVTNNVSVGGNVTAQNITVEQDLNLAPSPAPAASTDGKLFVSNGTAPAPNTGDLYYRLPVAQGGGLVDLVISSGSGTVTSLSQGNGIVLTPNPITTTGTIATNATSANTANTIISRDGSGNFSAGTASLSKLTLNGSVSGSLSQQASATTTSYTLTWPNAVAASNGQVLTSDTSGNLTWTTIPSSANTILNGGNTFGSAISIGSNDNFSTSIRTNGTDRLTVSNTGTVTIASLTPAGVVHNNASGLLSTSLIVNADVDPAAAIVDTKLATISTAGKVANSATSATSSNVPSTIVMRDASGNFSAGTITANLNGTATNATTAVNFSGSLSGDVTGTQSATVVSFVGGQSAANVASATSSVLAATPNDVGNRLVLRDASGNFSGSAIGATSLLLNASGSGTLTQQPNASTTSYAITWPGAVAASNGQALTSDTSGNLSWTTIPSTANAIVNGGNTFGSAISIGSNDNFSTSIRTNGTDRLTVSATGAVTIPSLTPAGVVHNNASGLLSTSLIVNADVDPAAGIVDTKLATISTAGKVANSATSATSSNVPSTIVMRDASGNFSAGTITANLNGTATNFSGSLSGDVTGTQSATVVSFVGGQSAANVASATTSVLAATPNDVGNRLVLRDASGNFSGSAIGATSLLLNASGSGTLTQKANASTTSYSITWPGAVAASNGQALTSDTSGNLSWTTIPSTANAIVNGGNTFGTAISIGSNDNFSTSIRTNGTDRLTVSATGGVTINTNLDMPNTTSSVGLISKAGSPFIHNFGTSNTFMGVNAGNLTLSGTNNASFGTSTLQNLTSGANNVAMGSQTLLAATTASDNVAIGYQAMRLSSGGSTSVAIGTQVLSQHTSSADNTAVGWGSLRLITAGSANTTLGAQTLRDMTSGSNNTVIGYNALLSNLTGSNNIALGYQAGVSLTGGESNNIMIGATGTAGDSGTIRIGTAGVHTATYVTGITGVNVGTNSAAVFVSSSGNTNQLGTIPSSKRFKQNIRSMEDDVMDQLMQLRPVSFTYKGDMGNSQDWGLIAEEVAEIMPSLVAYDDNHEPYTVRYHVLPTLLLQVVQKQREEIADLQRAVKEQNIRIEELMNHLTR